MIFRSCQTIFVEYFIYLERITMHDLPFHCQNGDSLVSTISAFETWNLNFNSCINFIIQIFYTSVVDNSAMDQRAVVVFLLL